MPRLVAFALLVLAAFSVGVPFLDRAGTALLGLAFLALATPRRPASLVSSALAAAEQSIRLPSRDAGQTPPSLRSRLEPYGVAGDAGEFAYASDDE